MLEYGWYAHRHNWTPAQVDELPAWYDARAADFDRVWSKVAASKQGGA